MDRTSARGWPGSAGMQRAQGHRGARNAGPQSQVRPAELSCISLLSPSCTSPDVCTTCIECISHTATKVACLQGSTPSDSASLLRLFTDGNRSFTFHSPLQMQRFLGAALTHCKLYPNDVAYVLRCLGSQDTAGLQRLRDISRFPHSVTVSIRCQLFCHGLAPYANAKYFW